ncbi:hypothetical protein PQ478_19195 [Alkalihalophilus pseudofirmus]|uniref:hypothetical protein n=1 Tax=Alkalihalophilus pseudofirmus TaxID=79885 RepID=UPI00259B34DA|nr:hypothetical protein [Alkalihalophilus pseudofirmus]WEG16604.1 hypothetical protein PQ478_19195 [Alkalihalophilus pseudofirmus]
MGVYKAWLIKLAAVCVVLVMLVGGFNYMVDPLWAFDHANPFNERQDSINEREQKSLHLAYTAQDYNALLLGSSRSTVVDQYQFEGVKMFNYSVPAVSIEEFNEYIHFAKKHGHEPELIVLGLDFFTTNETRKQTEFPSEYFETVEDPLHRFKTLLSMDTFEYSYKNAWSSLMDTEQFVRRYDRHHTAEFQQISQEDKDELVEGDLRRYKGIHYAPSYQYHTGYKNQLQQMVDENPNTDFIVYVTPVTEPLLRLLYEQERLPDYTHWIGEIIDVFGGVYNFMTINEVTTNVDRFYDAHHFYAEVGDVIAARLQDEEVEEADFGEWVTEETFEEHIEEVRQSLEAEAQ